MTTTSKKNLELQFTPWILGEEGIKGVRTYTYSCTDLSIMAAYIMQPVWAAFLQFIPLYIAPNLVTLFGFFFVMLSYFVTAYYSPTFSEELPPWVYLLNFVCLFLYQTLDALDGKQARRTNSSSALGELFDHGCDALTSIFSTITVFSTLRIGSSYGSYLNLLAMMFAFFAAQWEVYFTSTLRLWYINVTEAQFLGMSIHLLAFAYGSSFWTQPAPFLGFNMTAGEWLVPASGGFSLVTGLSSIYNVLTTTPRFKEAVINLIPCFWICALCSVWPLTYQDVFTTHPHTFHINMGFLFANIITKITTARVCKLTWRIDQWLLFPLPCVVALSSFNPDITLSLYTTLAIISYFVFSISVIHDITYVLDIYALKLKPKTQ